MFIFCCPKCKMTDLANEGEDKRCLRCNSQMFSSGISSAEWNKYTKEQMTKVIDNCITSADGEKNVDSIDNSKTETEIEHIQQKNDEIISKEVKKGDVDARNESVYIKPVCIEKKPEPTGGKAAPNNPQISNNTSKSTILDTSKNMKSSAKRVTVNSQYSSSPQEPLNPCDNVAFPISSILIILYVVVGVILGLRSVSYILLFISCIALGVTLMLKKSKPIGVSLFANSFGFFIIIINNLIAYPEYFRIEFVRSFVRSFLCDRLPTFLTANLLLILGVIMIKRKPMDHKGRLILKWIPITCLILKLLSLIPLISQYRKYDDTSLLKAIVRIAILSLLLYGGYYLMIIWMERFLESLNSTIEQHIHELSHRRVLQPTKKEDLSSTNNAEQPLIKKPVFPDTRETGPSNKSTITGFKRMEGHVGSLPQAFADNRIPKCPMCGTTNPHWSLSERWGKIMTFDPEENANQYLFKCERCDCILRVPVPDVVGLGRSVLTWQGLAKKKHGKVTNAIYVTIEETGNIQTSSVYKEKEMTLEELNALAEKI